MLTSLLDPYAYYTRVIHDVCLDGQSIDEAFGCFMLTSVAYAVGPSVTTFSTEFFLPKPGFWEFI
jgi:hypothetical protein